MLSRITAVRRLLEAGKQIDDLPGFLADLGRLLLRVSRDERVPRSAKLVAAGAGAYALSPLDLIPDIPLLGQLDDLWVLMAAVRHLVRATGRDVLRELWSGDDASFDALLGLAGLDA